MDEEKDPVGVEQITDVTFDSVSLVALPSPFEAGKEFTRRTMMVWAYQPAEHGYGLILGDDRARDHDDYLVQGLGDETPWFLSKNRFEQFFRPAEGIGPPEEKDMGTCGITMEMIKDFLAENGIDPAMAKSIRFTIEGIEVQRLVRREGRLNVRDDADEPETVIEKYFFAPPVVDDEPAVEPVKT